MDGAGDDVAYEYDGITLMLGGDIITGAIHQELADTNEAPVPATIAHWTPILASIIDYLADQFGRIWIASVDGNHDRTTMKPRMKLRA